jgi:prepilin-type N-terminal cleavage/methylation domain-containing protein
MMKKNSKKTAFSLIEISIVVLIIAILITGSLSSSITAINNAKLKSTRESMDEIYKALGNYLLVNGNLPCPASILELKSSSSSYGTSFGTAGTCSGVGVYTSATPGATNLVYGMVPVKTLGLSNNLAEDGFEDKIAYIVDKNFTNTSFGTSTSTATMTINEIPGSTTKTITDDAIFALVSYGINKSGAFPINSATQIARSSDASERTNDLDSIASPLFDKILITDSKSSDVFDDVVFYKTRNNLLLDFEALSLVPCQAGVLSLNYGGAANYSFAQGSYNQLVVSTTQCPVGYRSTTNYPTRRCGVFGVWDSVAVNPCTP